MQRRPAPKGTPPPSTRGLRALALAGGAPLLALELDALGMAALDADMQESLRQLAAGSVDVTLLADRWMKSNPGLRITWLENWITQRVHASLGDGYFASKCGTRRLACRFT